MSKKPSIAASATVPQSIGMSLDGKVIAPLFGHFVQIASRRYALPLHFVRGRLYFALKHYESAAREFRTVLLLNWRHENAALWIEKTERARRRDRSGNARLAGSTSDEITSTCRIDERHAVLEGLPLFFAC